MEATLIDRAIEEHMPFIIKTLSSFTGRYISVEHDEELSIALMAFNEAIDKYDESKGEFIPFAKLVIISRLKNYYVRENKHSKVISLDKLREDGMEFREEVKNEDKDELKNEVRLLGETLSEFGFTFDDLVEEAPKHKDTRRNAIRISKDISEEKTLTTIMFQKKRLPIKKVSIRFNITEKILKRSKKFIISVVIIFFKNYRNLRLWIEG